MAMSQASSSLANRSFQCNHCSAVFEIDPEQHHALDKWDKVILHMDQMHPQWTDENPGQQKTPGLS